MRVYATYIFVVAFSLYAWRNWRVSLYALILFSAVYQHEDMPRSLLEMRGLGTWNVLLVSVVTAWAVDLYASPRRLGIRSPLSWLLVLYILVLLVAGVRGAFDLENYRYYGWAMTVRAFTVENIVTPLKFMLPALLLFDACRTRRDVLWACLSIGGFVVLDGLLIMKRLSPTTLLGDVNYHRLRHRVGAVTGYHPNDMALMLVMTFWSIIGFLKVLKGHRWLRVAALGGAAVCALATGLCYSRGGFVAFLGVGLLVGAVGRARVALLVLAVMLAAAIYSPSIASRAMEGITESQDDAGDEEDTLTAGRTSVIWPIVIEGIAEQPVIGHGREAIRRTLARRAMDRYGAALSHPHNAYLEILLDGGVISFAVVMGLFGYLLFISVRLIRRGPDPLTQAVGNAGLATLGAWMIMGISGQHFYASENTIALLCVLAVVARVYADANDRRRLRPVG